MSGFGEKVIRVSGSGSATAPSSEATIEGAVTNIQPSVSDASKHVSAASQAVHEKLLQMDALNEKDVTTTNISVTTEHHYSPTGERGPPRYRVSQSLRVKLTNATGEMVSQVVDAMVGAAGDTLEIHSVSFGIPDSLQAELLREARKAACVDARAKAELLAESLGVKVGDVLEISDAPGHPGPRPPTPFHPPAMREMAATEASFEAPVSIGNTSITDHVFVIFSIQST